MDERKGRPHHCRDVEMLVAGGGVSLTVVAALGAPCRDVIQKHFPCRPAFGWFTKRTRTCLPCMRSFSPTDMEAWKKLGIFDIRSLFLFISARYNLRVFAPATAPALATLHQQSSCSPSAQFNSFLLVRSSLFHDT